MLPPPMPNKHNSPLFPTSQHLYTRGSDNYNTLGYLLETVASEAEAGNWTAAANNWLEGYDRLINADEYHFDKVSFLRAGLSLVQPLMYTSNNPTQGTQLARSILACGWDGAQHTANILQQAVIEEAKEFEATGEPMQLTEGMLDAMEEQTFALLQDITLTAHSYPKNWDVRDEERWSADEHLVDAEAKMQRMAPFNTPNIQWTKEEIKNIPVPEMAAQLSPNLTVEEVKAVHQRSVAPTLAEAEAVILNIHGYMPEGFTDAQTFLEM